LLVLGTVLPAFAQSSSTPGAEPAVAAAREFARALTDADPSALKPLLPQRGKVKLRLDRLGPEQGAYSAGQVLALFDDFLQEGSVRSFKLAERCEGDGETYALIHGIAHVIDREGREAEVALNLTFIPEDGRWILREIRETLP
jgi:hypothetical protein